MLTRVCIYDILIWYDVYLIDIENIYKICILNKNVELKHFTICDSTTKIKCTDKFDRIVDIFRERKPVGIYNSNNMISEVKYMYVSVEFSWMLQN